jgi:SAM-dependent methyltransferase
VARSVARALKPGGHFYFDVNNRLAFREMWPRTWYLEVPGVAVVMQGGSAPELDRAWSNVHWFIQDGDAWRRHDERVDEVCWSPAEIRSALEAAGFTGIRRWDAAQFFGGDPHVRPGHRTYWLARKPRG